MAAKESESADANGKHNPADDSAIEIPEEDAGSGEDEGEDEDEAEYEIEAILKDRKIKGGGHEYLVSWKDYGPEHNSWVLEKDFGSTEMIEEYWKATALAKTKVGRPAKGPSQAPASSQRSKRKAASPESANGASSSKRQKSSQRQKEPAVVSSDEEDDTETFATSHKDAIDKYADFPSWEEQVKSIETVERAENGKLIVYLIMKGGEKTAQEAETLYTRCPRQMLKFYERNLKWKEVSTK